MRQSADFSLMVRHMTSVAHGRFVCFAGSVSFGCARDFLLRNNADRGLKYTAKLGGKGDVLIMSGSCQRDWQHSVPKRSNALGPRINLTFRTIVKPDA